MMRLVPIVDELETVRAAARVRIGHDLVPGKVDMALEFLLLRRGLAGRMDASAWY